MYKTFSIKGEVYDATTISEVIVYLVDVNGTVLKQLVAEGTNTFSARFDNPFGDEKVCFYYAVAKDAGGNLNTYCYHSSDIRRLLAESQNKTQQHIETNTTFPSINSIGYVDQGQENKLTDQIDTSALVNVKIDNNKSDKKADSFPGFNYFAQDTAQVQWLNIKKEGTADIAIGTPVLGTIMPPTDQSALDYSSVTVWVAHSVDGSLENFEPYSDSNKIECCTIANDEEGNKQVKLKPVGESLSFQIDSHPGNNDNWKSGYYKVKIYFKTDTNVEGSDECTFQVTSGAPKLTEGNFAENEFSSYYRGYMTATTVSQSKNFLSGKSLTSDEASPVEIEWKYIGTAINGNKFDSPAYDVVPDSEGYYQIPIEINSNTHENDGEYTYTITAAPNSTLSTVISRVVVIDTTNPVITLNNLENGRILDEKNYVIKGNIDDANGIKQVEYQLFSDDTQILANGTNADGWTIIDGAKSTIELNLSNLEINKNYTLKLRATDVAENINGENDYTYTFTLDNVKPEITTTVSPLIMYDNDSNSETPEEETVNGTIKVNTKVSDSNKLKAVYYTFNTSLADDADWSSENKFTSSELSNGKIIEVNTTTYADKSKLPLRIKAVDAAENYTIEVVNPVINQESDRPMIDPSNFDKPEKVEKFEDSGWIGTTSFNVFGQSNPNMIFTVSDDDSVKEYFAKVNDGEYVKVADVNSAQKIVTYSLSNLISNENYGRHKITLKIVDSNYKDNVTTPNNFVEEVFYIAIDDGQPKLSLDNISGQFVGNSFILSGNAIDKNGISSIELQDSNENIYASLGIGTGLNDDGTFSYEFIVPDVKDTIFITAMDGIGNSTMAEFVYLVDSAEPTVELSGTSVAIDGQTPQTRIEGRAFDNPKKLNDNGVSKIDQVRYKIGSSITGIDDPDAFLATGKIDENGIMTWSAVLDFNDLVEENETKTFTVYAAAFDFAGNMSEQKSIPVSVDGDFPSISQDYTDNHVGEKTASFEIEGYVSDSSGVKEVTAKIQSTNRVLTGMFDSLTGYWSFTVPEDVGDGKLTIVVTAIDNCNKSSYVNLTATLDTKDPTIDFTNINSDGSTKQTNSSPVVNISYSDETSGVVTIEYKFLYKSATPNSYYSDFKEYEYDDEDASGTLECKNATSGNSKIYMAGRTSASNKGPFIDQTSDTDGQWKLWYRITDAAGHSTEGESPVFVVDRHAPVLEVKQPVANALKKENDALTVSGTVVDNYGGTLDRVEVQINHPSYSEQDRLNFRKTFTLNDGLVYDESEYLYTWTCSWDEQNSPFKYANDYEIVVTAYDTAENQYEIKNKVSCDKKAPIIKFVKPYSYSVDAYGTVNDSAGSVNSPIGSTTVTANIEENNAMRGIFYQIGGTAKITSTGVGTEDFKITNINIENPGIVDTTEEGVTENPGLEQRISAGLLTGIWKKLGDANNGFTADIDTLKYFQEGKTVELLDDSTENDNEVIQTLEIHLVALDEAGNINYCAMPIKVDTDTDKPELLVLSPKIIDSTANVGGTTTISGTVSDDNNVHSVWMNVELVGGNYVNNILTQKGASTTTFGVDYSQGDYGIVNPQSITVDEVNNTFTSPVEDDAYFADKTKWYKVYLTEQAKSTTWNLMLNKYSEFDITTEEFKKYFESDASELEETTLNIRVIALDVKDGNANLEKSKLSDDFGFTLKIDSGSPSIIINNIDKIPVEGSYIGGTINYDLTFTDDGEISYWEVSAKGSKGETIIDSGNPNLKTFSKTVLLDTAAINDVCGNVITLKIYAEDNSKDASGQVENNKTSEETFKYTIDNSAPVASVVETIDEKDYLIATESVVGDATGAHRETDSRGNHLRIKSQSALLSGKISDEVNGSGVDYVMLYFTKNVAGTEYIYNAGKSAGNEIENENTISVSITGKDGETVTKEIPSPVASLSDVKRNNNAQSTTDYIIIDKAEGLLDKGSNGDGDGYDENLKANGEWMVTIDSTNLKDGVYEIYYVVVDNAGNANYYSDTMLVQNSAPIISSVVLSTDIDSDGVCESTVDGSGEEDKIYDSTSNFASTDFVVRNNKMQIRVNVLGGTAPLKYFLKYTSASGEVTTDKNADGYSTGIFTIDSFPADGSANYIVWVEDSVEQDLSLSSEIETIGVTLDNQDGEKPVAQLFELNTIIESSASANEDRGSLFTIDNVIQGHIEPRANSKFPSEGTTPDISGKVILRGEVLDDQRIESITLNLNGTNIIIASWSSTNNILVSENEATLVKNELGLSGHYVEWQYVWDTNSIVGSDILISVIAKDGNLNASEDINYSDVDNIPRTENNMFSLDAWGYNDMNVDIVPYITDIKRNSGYTTKRSRSGSYPLLRGETGNIIEGFNLTAGTALIKLTTEKTGGSEVASMENVSEIGNNISFTIPVTAKDGYLQLVVDSIPALNNINDSSLKTNIESNPYNTSSKYWTDDRFVRIWQDTDRFGNDDLSKNPVYPAMAMSDDGVLYASYTNYSKHNVYHTTIGGASTAVFNGYDAPEETAILVTGPSTAPKINVAYMGNYQSSGEEVNWNVRRHLAGGLHLWDDYIEHSDEGSVYDRGANGKFWMTRFELLYHNKQFQQFKNFRLARKDTSNTANIHIAYYDITTMSIHYSVVNGAMRHYGGQDWEACWVNIDGGFDSDDVGKPGSGSSSITRQTDGDNITLSDSRFEPGLSRTSATGEYVGIDLTSNGYPVVAYYDSVNKVVKLARANTDVAKYDESCWTVQRVITDSSDPNYTTTNGNYVDMQIDSEGYVHVVFVNGRGELIYVKSTNNPNDGNTAYTFEKSVVIAENSPMNVDITVKGTTPYIGYLTSLGSFDGLNTAFWDSSLDLDNDGVTEGGWETMSAPLENAVSNNRASVEVHPNPSDSTAWGESAHAYYSAGYYRVAYYIGNGEGH